ncbi:cellulose binding domain-containing protein [Streptomyces sp. ST2-7A]|nr:cellulose binding domain-containing protein [Streptomyces sp. ST2-7A]MCE7078701.1 cellulose binding domain-containing protein [Streptomyces sp. ST2-7A]
MPGGTETGSGGGHAAVEPVRIMPLGDSITGSPGCWRAMLWDDLRRAGHTNIDFVGTLGPQGCGIPHDGDNEGHGGALVTDIADRGQLVGWLAVTRPDVVLMHFGTNDAWSARPTDTILDAYTTLLGQMRAHNPEITLLVAQLIPLEPPTCAACAGRVVALNERVPGWVASVTTDRSPVIAVDQWTGFDTAVDTYDGVHPVASGDRKIADRWFPALTGVLTDGGSGPGGGGDDGGPGGDGGVGDPGGTTAGGADAGPGDPPADASCAALPVFGSSWPGGFQFEVTVTNTGTVPITGWSVHLPTITADQVWGGTAEPHPDGGTLVTNVAWNGTVAPGNSVSFGLIGSGSGSTDAPPPGCVPRTG